MALQLLNLHGGLPKEENQHTSRCALLGEEDYCELSRWRTLAKNWETFLVNDWSIWKMASVQLAAKENDDSWEMAFLPLLLSCRSPLHLLLLLLLLLLLPHQVIIDDVGDYEEEHEAKCRKCPRVLVSTFTYFPKVCINRAAEKSFRY